MMSPAQNPEQSTVVECEDLDSRPAAGTHTLLFAALLCSLPIYLLILFLTDDPIFTGRWTSGRGNSSQQARHRLVVKRVMGMDFAPLETEPINSTEELLKAMVCTFEPRSGAYPEKVYLRIGSCERFSAGGMETQFGKMPDGNWPDFALSSVPRHLDNAENATADLQFYCNFEERLPHCSPLRSLAGPLAFCAMRDGSLVLEQTIAVGDEFEVEYVNVPTLDDSDRFAAVASDSPYLALGFMDSVEMRHKTREIIGDALSDTAAVYKIVAYLESNGLYKPNYRQFTDLHPVKEFLLKSMTGSCQHFSAALVLLCRMHGIPSRVASGFAAGPRSGNRFVIVGGMAHAWAEVLTENGWKSVDVFPQRTDSPAPIAPGVAMPSVAQLESTKARLKQENAQRFAGGGSGDADSDDFAEKPPRMLQKIAVIHDFVKAQTPGTVVKDSARAEKQKKETEEKKRRKEEDERRRSLKKSFRAIAALLLLAAIIWLIIQNAEKWLKWLLKLRKKKAEQQQEQSGTANEELLRGALVKMSAMNEFELQGKDVIILFNRFAKFMEARGLLPRQEHETPGEYFDRLCVELNLRPADGKIAAQCFEAELYGGQPTASAEVRKFLQFLQQILNKIS